MAYKVPRKKNLDKKEMDKQTLVNTIREESQNMLMDNINSKAKESTKYILEKFENKQPLNSIQIMAILTKGTMLQNVISGQPKYTPYQLKEAFNVYLEMIGKINEYTNFPPTLESFTSFIGVSLTTFKNWCQDIEKQEVCESIVSFITGAIAQGSLVGELKEISSIYQQKVLGKVESTTPTVIRYEKEYNIDDIQAQIKNLKSQNVIEANYEDK